MTNLVTAYQNDDIEEFERILQTNRSLPLQWNLSIVDVIGTDPD